MSRYIEMCLNSNCLKTLNSFWIYLGQALLACYFLKNNIKNKYRYENIWEASQTDLLQK